MRFKNRVEAGKILAQSLKEYAAREDVIILALPRGGVPVAFEIAEALDAPLDVLVVRKLGVPGEEELAMGAIASGGVHVLNDEVVRGLGISGATIEATVQWELRELNRREKSYRGERAAPNLKERTVILVDDGLATGSTMRAAVAAVRRQRPSSIVVAAPVAAASSCELFNAPDQGLSCVCAECVAPFFAVGMWYENFAQTTDEEVRHFLGLAWRRNASDPIEGHSLERPNP